MAQTNLKEVRPEFWEKLEQEYSMPKVEKDEQFAFEPVDRMIADNRWICPINRCSVIPPISPSARMRL